MIVRNGANDTFRFLGQTFAGEAVHILWDRRLAEDCPNPMVGVIANALRVGTWIVDQAEKHAQVG